MRAGSEGQADGFVDPFGPLAAVAPAATQLPASGPQRDHGAAIHQAKVEVINLVSGCDAVSKYKFV